MYQFETKRDSRKVITMCNDNGDVFRSRLYVNNGTTATQVAATHRTETGARKWARRMLDYSTVGELAKGGA